MTEKTLEQIESERAALQTESQRLRIARERRDVAHWQQMDRVKQQQEKASQQAE